MLIRVGIENNNEGRSIAWALEHPGLFAYGADAAQAEAAMSQAARDYAAWAGSHGAAWLSDGAPDVRVDQVYDVYEVDQTLQLAEPGPNTWMVESFFRYDWKPLTAGEIERALKLLSWSRADLLQAVQGLGADQLNQTRPGERWSILGILRHVAGGEWFYQERIGFASPEREEDLPQDPFEQLEFVRSQFAALLPRMEGVVKVVGQEGELWSPRKMLRRAAWHERDHTAHIRKLLEAGRHAG